MEVTDVCNISSALTEPIRSRRPIRSKNRLGDLQDGADPIQRLLHRRHRRASVERFFLYLFSFFAFFSFFFRCDQMEFDVPWILCFSRRYPSKTRKTGTPNKKTDPPRLSCFYLGCAGLRKNMRQKATLHKATSLGCPFEPS